MFPIRDHNPSGRTPYVVYALLAANIGVFLLMLPAFGDDRVLWSIYRDWALIPQEVSRGRMPGTLVTSIFLHGGFLHLAGNMLFLWIFGDNLEDEMGHVPFLIFYLACGIGAGLVHVMAAPGSPVPTVGASGAIAGVMGGYLLLYPRARVDILIIIVVFFKIFPIPAWVMLGLWLALQFIGGVGADPDQGGVAYWAHAGGFFAGFVLTVPLWLKRGGTAFWNKTLGLPPHPKAEYRYSASRIPRVRRR